MSCYVCEDNHFNYLVQAAREYKARVRMAGDYMPPEDLYHDDFAAAVARMLKRENLRSYCHRYPDETMPELEAITTRYTDPARSSSRACATPTSLASIPGGHRATLTPRSKRS